MSYRNNPEWLKLQDRYTNPVGENATARLIDSITAAAGMFHVERNAELLAPVRRTAGA